MSKQLEVVDDCRNLEKSRKLPREIKHLMEEFMFFILEKICYSN